jgi:hypothetical protein
MREGEAKQARLRFWLIGSDSPVAPKARTAVNVNFLQIPGSVKRSAPVQANKFYAGPRTLGIEFRGRQRLGCLTSARFHSLRPQPPRQVGMNFGRVKPYGDGFNCQAGLTLEYRLNAGIFPAQLSQKALAHRQRDLCVFTRRGAAAFCQRD